MFLAFQRILFRWFELDKLFYCLLLHHVQATLFIYVPILLTVYQNVGMNYREQKRIEKVSILIQKYDSF